MRKIIYSTIFVLLFSFSGVLADDNSSPLEGRILLQVEQNGEAWYVNPVDDKRVFLGRPHDAFEIMRKLGLGVSNADYENFLKTGVPERLLGRILIKVEDYGRAYYVNPTNMKMLYLGRPVDAFDVMKNTGLGITDLDLDKIAVSDEFVIEEKKEKNRDLSLDIDELCLGAAELDLANRINKYRLTRSLDEITLSKSLSYVAKIHLKDLVDNKPVTSECNAHSWSGNGPWQECCYPENAECIQSKARELTDYDDHAVENIHWWDDVYHTPSPEGALDGWINSEGHHIVIINNGWAKDFEWKALGVAIYKNYAAMWVGASTDSLGVPPKCETCSGFDNKEWEYSCYSDKAIFENDKNYCSYVNNSLEEEVCGVRTDIYSCSSVYGDSNFECYKDLIKKDVVICDYLYEDKADIENCQNFSNW